MTLSFLQVGSEIDPSSSKSGDYIKLEDGEYVDVVMLTDFDTPDGEEFDGKNGIIAYQQYQVWLNPAPESGVSPMFPLLPGKHDVGATLNSAIPDPTKRIQPRFTALALVGVIEDGELVSESIWRMTTRVFKDLAETADTLGQIKGQVLRIKRTGSGLKTKYSIVVKGQQVEVEGEPETNLLDSVGNFDPDATAEELEAHIIREILEPVQAELMTQLDMTEWPFGGTKKPARKKSTKRTARKKPATKKKPLVVEEPEESDDWEDDDWGDEEE